MRQSELPSPVYNPPTDVSSRPLVGLAVESMKRHMTNEGWELFAGLEHAGYTLYGHNLPHSSTHVPTILSETNPLTVVVQDKREWEGLTAGGNGDPRMRFTGVRSLRERSDVFRVTVLKDAQNSYSYHRRAADEMGAHAWVVYYLPSRVKQLAPYVRERHLVRTYHTVDKDIVPVYSSHGREGCLLSGAVSDAYPLRRRLAQSPHAIPKMTVLRHPGYHRKGSCTPAFLQTLSKYKVAICTASVYGYALRKIVEATACGCAVVTDLPHDDVLPGIEGNLHRVPNNASLRDVGSVVSRLLEMYNPDKQAAFARVATDTYDYRVEGKGLANAIEELRCRWAST